MFSFFLMNICHFAIFTRERSEGGESVVSFTHEQNIICSQTQLDDIAHEQTSICRQLFAGQVVGSRPMKRKEDLHRIMNHHHHHHHHHDHHRILATLISVTFNYKAQAILGRRSMTRLFAVKMPLCKTKNDNTRQSSTKKNFAKKKTTKQTSK